MDGNYSVTNAGHAQGPASVRRNNNTTNCYFLFQRLRITAPSGGLEPIMVFQVVCYVYKS